jgi:hypothetical protein
MKFIVCKDFTLLLFVCLRCRTGAEFWVLKLTLLLPGETVAAKEGSRHVDTSDSRRGGSYRRRVWLTETTLVQMNIARTSLFQYLIEIQTFLPLNSFNSRSKLPVLSVVLTQ